MDIHLHHRINHLNPHRSLNHMDIHLHHHIYHLHLHHSLNHMDMHLHHHINHLNLHRSLNHMDMHHYHLKPIHPQEEYIPYYLSRYLINKSSKEPLHHHHYLNHQSQHRSNKPAEILQNNRNQYHQN